MKKLIMVCLVFLSGCSVFSGESGGYFDSNTKKKKPDAVSRIEAAGLDIRVYEFTPETASNKQCIFAVGGKKAGLVCFDKEH